LCCSFFFSAVGLSRSSPRIGRPMTTQLLSKVLSGLIEFRAEDGSSLFSFSPPAAVCKNPTIISPQVHPFLPPKIFFWTAAEVSSLRTLLFFFSSSMNEHGALAPLFFPLFRHPLTDQTRKDCLFPYPCCAFNELCRGQFLSSNFWSAARSSLTIFFRAPFPRSFSRRCSGLFPSTLSPSQDHLLYRSCRFFLGVH